MHACHDHRHLVHQKNRAREEERHLNMVTQGHVNISFSIEPWGCFVNKNNYSHCRTRNKQQKIILMLCIYFSFLHVMYTFISGIYHLNNKFFPLFLC